MSMRNFDRKALVVRHNRLIESRYSLSLVERRFLLWVISQIKKEDRTLKTYRISVREWEQFCGLKPSKDPYAESISLVRRLTTRNVEVLDEKGKKFHTFSWFTQATYAYGDGYIEVGLNEKLQDLFLQLSREYTSISLEYALLLNSSYAGRIYDLLKQYEKIGERIVSVDDFREMLILGSKYPNFKDLRVNVIEVAQRDIADKTDIRFDWKPVKTGRKVTAIHFSIFRNKPKITTENPEVKDPEKKRLFERLRAHGVQEDRARATVSDYEADRVGWHIDFVEKELKAGRKIDNVGGFLCTAIKEDYRRQKSLFQEEQERELAERQEARKQQARIDEALERISSDVRTENRRLVREKIKSFSDEDRAAFDAWFVSELENGTAIEQTIFETFQKSGTQEAIVQATYEIKVRERFPEVTVSPIEYAEQKGFPREVIGALEAQGEK